MSSTGKVAVITGASQGIGAGLVRGFLERGYRVVANSRSIEAAASEETLAVAGDIADPEVADRVVGGAVEAFGRVDTLINNAGIFIASHPEKESLRQKWMEAKDRRAGRAGWNFTASRVNKGADGLDLPALLDRIEEEMPRAIPEVQWTMNNTLAAI